MIGLIVARSKNNVIGKNGEIGHPLPKRKNIIVSKGKNFSDENLVTVRSLQEAIDISTDEDIYISRGYGLFKEALPLVDKMYITEVDITVDNGDVFFPEFDVNEFDIYIGETGGDDIKFTRTIYTRKKQIRIR